MSASVNKVILVGNLGRDPEVRYSPDGAAVCNVTVATSSQWKDKNTGEQRETTEWHRVVFYNRLAEIAGEYLRKGKQIYVEGKLKTRKWQGQDGQDRYTTEIVADQMQMLGGRDGDGSGGGGGGDFETRQPARQPQQRSSYADQKGRSAPRQPAPAAANLADMDDDIPF